MEIEDFITQWTEGQCRKFAAEIEEYDNLMAYLTDIEVQEEEDNG